MNERVAALLAPVRAMYHDDCRTVDLQVDTWHVYPGIQV